MQAAQAAKQQGKKRKWYDFFTPARLKLQSPNNLYTSCNADHTLVNNDHRPIRRLLANIDFTFPLFPSCGFIQPGELHGHHHPGLVEDDHGSQVPGALQEKEEADAGCSGRQAAGEEAEMIVLLLYCKPVSSSWPMKWTWLWFSSALGPSFKKRKKQIQAAYYPSPQNEIKAITELIVLF